LRIFLRRLNIQFWREMSVSSRETTAPLVTRRIILHAQVIQMYMLDVAKKVLGFNVLWLPYTQTTVCPDVWPLSLRSDCIDNSPITYLSHVDHFLCNTCPPMC